MSTLQDNELIRINDLKVSFPLEEGTVRALRGVDLVMKKNRVIGVVGESGCGKSITARSILRILPEPGQIDAGEILFQSNETNAIIDIAKMDLKDPYLRKIRGGEISMIFQEPMNSFSVYHTIGDQIMEVVLEHQDVSKNTAREMTIEMLHKVGIPNASTRVDQYTHEYSGGMRQRAMIAMALICHPSLLIADEPTTSLDVTIQAQVLTLMKNLQEEFHSSIMFITHNLGVIAQIADEVAIMYLGYVVERGTVQDIFHRPKHPYTENLLKAIPKIGKTKGQRLDAIEGMVPGSFEIVHGCPFHDRCEKMIAGICDQMVPRETSIDGEHKVSCFLYE